MKTWRQHDWFQSFCSLFFVNAKVCHEERRRTLQSVLTIPLFQVDMLTKVYWTASILCIPSKDVFIILFVIWSWVRKMTHWVNTNQSCYLINTSSCFYWHIKSLLKQQIIYQCVVKTLYYIQTTKIVTNYNTVSTD